MRYRGGGVGHLYMRGIEEWLWKTGWGVEIPDVETQDMCQGRPQLASPLTMTKGFEVLDGVKADLSI